MLYTLPESVINGTNLYYYSLKKEQIIDILNDDHLNVKKEVCL